MDRIVYSVFEWWTVFYYCLSLAYIYRKIENNNHYYFLDIRKISPFRHTVIFFGKGVIFHQKRNDFRDKSV